MVSCMFGGPTPISKMLPIAKLSSSFLYEQISLTMDAINQSSCEKVSVFGVILVRIQFECGRIQSRITPSSDTFHANVIWNDNRYIS